MSDAHRCGFASLVGRPNAGKSTLLNALLGAKLAIVASKPQTTRTSIQGVLTLVEAQVVFVDTPGILKPESALHRRMMEAVKTALEEPDLLVFVADASSGFRDADRDALAALKRVVTRRGTPALLALNKVDRIQDKRQLLPVIDHYRQELEFAEYIPISARTRVGLDLLRAAVVARMPEGPALYPPDYLTDQPERFLAAELIREKILAATREEVPHSVAVLIETWDDATNLLRIAATIYVEKSGQKIILIGSGGSMLKHIGAEARREMETLFGRKIYLELFVKVRPAWRQNALFLNELDWRSAE